MTIEVIAFPAMRHGRLDIGSSSRNSFMIRELRPLNTSEIEFASTSNGTNSNSTMSGAFNAGLSTGAGVLLVGCFTVCIVLIFCFFSSSAATREEAVAAAAAAEEEGAEDASGTPTMRPGAASSSSRRGKKEVLSAERIQKIEDSMTISNWLLMDEESGCFTVVSVKSRDDSEALERPRSEGRLVSISPRTRSSRSLSQCELGNGDNEGLHNGGDDVCNNNNTNHTDDDDLRSIDLPGCAICLAPFEKGDLICAAAKNPSCLHVFHSACMKDWLIRRDHCPICRANWVVMESG